MSMLTRNCQSRDFNQNIQKQNDDNGYQRISKPYQKRNADASIEVQPEDEQKIEQILGKARSTIVVDLIGKADELTSTDLEIISEVQKHIEEEQKQVVEEENVDTFVCFLSKCYISGCEVHTILPTCIHYGNNNGTCYGRIRDMSPRMKKGYDYYCKNPDCSHIEVYERHICVVQSNGTTQVIEE